LSSSLSILTDWVETHSKSILTVLIDVKILYEKAQQMIDQTNVFIELPGYSKLFLKILQYYLTTNNCRFSCREG